MWWRALACLALIASGASDARGFAGFSEVFERSQARDMKAPVLECLSGASGVCLAVAHTTTPTAGILVARSIDGGNSFDQTPTFLSSQTNVDEPQLSCAGIRCMAVWRVLLDETGLRFGFSRSDDGGLNWSALVAPLDSDTFLGTLTIPGLACWEDAGDLSCVLTTTVENSQKRAITMRYDGVQWLGSSIQTVASVATIGGRESIFGRVGCSPDGSLCVAVFEGQAPGSSPVTSLLFAIRSVDAGASWSAPVFVQVSDRTQTRLDLGEVAAHTRPAVKCLDQLGCVVAVEVTSALVSEVEEARTADGGLSWSQLATLASGGGRDARRPGLACDEDAVRCVIAWEDDSPGRFPAFSVTVDRGTSWSAPVDMSGGLTVGAAEKNVHDKSGPTCTNGRCVVVLESTEPGTFQEGITGALVLPAAPSTESPTQTPTAAPTTGAGSGGGPDPDGNGDGDNDEEESAGIDVTIIAGAAAAPVVILGAALLWRKRNKRSNDNGPRLPPKKHAHEHETLSPGFTFSLPMFQSRAVSKDYNGANILMDV